MRENNIFICGLRNNDAHVPAVGIFNSVSRIHTLSNVTRLCDVPYFFLVYQSSSHCKKINLNYRLGVFTPTPEDILRFTHFAVSKVIK